MRGFLSLAEAPIGSLVGYRGTRLSLPVFALTSAQEGEGPTSPYAKPSAGRGLGKKGKKRLYVKAETKHLQDGDGFDFHARAFGQGGDGDAGAGRGIGAEGFTVYAVHDLEFGHVHDEHGHFGHIRGRGSGFRKDAAELEKLLAFAEDETVLNELTAVKKANKQALADWLLHTQNVTVNTDAVFDIQSKRLHEYKRQQLNLLYLIHQYHEIKAGHLPAVPLVSIFGAKAAPAYTIAKDIIHALLTLSKVIAADPEVSKWLQVVFIENYNVTAAEKLIPACDLSEQISLASKEASGTGNMKFMLNGALTLGTMDGANVEICQQVGEENIYIFGQTSDQVIHRYAAGDYCAAQWYEGDANIRRATGPEMLAAGHAENLTRLHDELVHKDWFQTLPDFNAYVVRKGQALDDYACDPLGWRKKCLVNIAKAGFFSSDRTIAEYDRDIWHLGQ